MCAIFLSIFYSIYLNMLSAQAARTRVSDRLTGEPGGRIEFAAKRLSNANWDSTQGINQQHSL